MQEYLTAEERARQFVLRYSNLFTEDKEWWIATLALEFLAAQQAQLKTDAKMTLEIIGQVKS